MASNPYGIKNPYGPGGGYYGIRNPYEALGPPVRNRPASATKHASPADSAPLAADVTAGDWDEAAVVTRQNGMAWAMPSEEMRKYISAWRTPRSGDQYAPWTTSCENDAPMAWYLDQLGDA